ncbi:MAG TPA: inositol monophosphatase family protein [Candidatus Limnocylindria bacterium]|nr:inositol monophosphatase family protein [Candidatus Limnocylindria bacterium]
MSSTPPTASTFARELKVATDAARRAGQLQMERYEKLERIVHKSEHDVVTEVDELSEQLIIGAIREAFPTDSFLAEESGHSGKSEADKSLGRVWVIDPLDGTINYANGIPFFCTAIGLAVEGVPKVGVVYDPTRDEMFSAVAGEGATLNGGPVKMPVKDRLVDCVASLSLPRRRWFKRDKGTGLRRSIRVSRSMGSAALAIAYLSNGRFDAMVQSGGMSAWDVCAAGVIASEGGARLTTLEGGPWFDINRPTKSIGLLGAAPVHHRTLLELLS